MMVKNKIYSLPKVLSDNLEVHAKKFKPKALSQYIMRLSNIYQNEKKHTPWEDEGLKTAYLTYFLPLNYLRSQAVIDRIQKNNSLNAIGSFYEIGSGPGTSHFNFLLNNFNFESHFYEISKNAIACHKELLGALSLSSMPCTWETHSNRPESHLIEKNNALTLFCYSLNELNSLPAWVSNAHNILFIEPSTQVSSRELSLIRNQYLKLGFYALAPCTHQKPCPMITHSKKDWCHDRIHVKLPAWFEDIENHLPIKNNTLTFSYLFLSKTPPKAKLDHVARVIGDTQKQKGKTIQMICRGDKREFLSWVHKDKINQYIERGSLVQLPEDIELKSSELRMKKDIKCFS